MIVSKIKIVKNFLFFFLKKEIDKINKMILTNMFLIIFFDQYKSKLKTDFLILKYYYKKFNSFINCNLIIKNKK